jgi:hypothetical protein
VRPETLALRATNQYHSRDVIAYIGLRYYFSNVCAQRDRWAKSVSTHLVRTRTQATYFKSAHFKDFCETGKVRHRNIFVPGPNEAFAEAALLAVCAESAAFTPLPCVFSYHLARGTDSQGVFVPYFDGFRRRHEHIREACQKNSDAVVFYTDIKKFYPSIPAAAALDSWNNACEESDLPPQWRELGLKLLTDHSHVSKENQDGKGILTGPMFSHLIANLVLRGVDEQMTQLFPKRYFRYVDDVVLVGPKDEIQLGRAALAGLLGSLDLHLHDQNQDKDFEVTASKWLEGAADFDNQDGQKWANFVGSLKQFLAAQPEMHSVLTDQFQAADFRIPLPIYALDIRHAPWLLRLRSRLSRYSWLRRLIENITAPNLVLTAHALREQYARVLREQISHGNSTDRYTRKRAIPKLRFLAGRLLYLGSREMLMEFSAALHEIAELRMLSGIIYAVATRDVSNLLPMGTNAVQSAAQVLCLSQQLVSCDIQIWTPVCLQGLAILRLNGVAVEGPTDDPLNRLAAWSAESSVLMAAECDPSLRELACLHGVSEKGRHAETLHSAFDWDEALAFDVINQVRDSDY